MENYLLSAAIGDIAGSAYESHKYRTKEYGKVKLFSSRVRFTDDTVLTFACAETLLKGLDTAINIWMCANQHRHAGFSTTFLSIGCNHMIICLMEAREMVAPCDAVLQVGWPAQKRSASTWRHRQPCRQMNKHFTSFLCLSHKYCVFLPPIHKTKI